MGKDRGVIAALIATGIGVLTATGVWLLLRARSFDIPLGLTLLSYAVNLFIFAMGRVAVGTPPILRPGVAPTLEHYADPLPQALVLTAIVIGFAMTALLLGLALKARFVNGSDLVDAALPGDDLEVEPRPRDAADVPGGGGR
jgi:multicomponent K+:H+ antiporter subunit C